MFVIVTLTMLGYGLIHSWLASTHLKQYIRRLVGSQRYDGFYRLSYNLFAIVSLSPILGLIILRPGGTVWQATGIPTVFLLIIQFIGLVGVMLSLLQIDLGQFLGLTQLMAYFKGQQLPLADEPLQFNGVYRLVRHPLYVFSLLVIWPMSPMSESLLAFNVCTTIYFVVGSILEERKLIAIYGEKYRAYQQLTPAFIPFLKSLR